MNSFTTALFLITLAPQLHAFSGLSSPRPSGRSAFLTRTPAQPSYATLKTPLFVSLTTSSAFGLPDDIVNGSDITNTESVSVSSSQDDLSLARQRRISEEAERQAHFVTGDDLHELREEVISLMEELEQARDQQDTDRAQELETAILLAQQVDAEFIYMVATERMQAAQQAGRMSKAAEYKRQAVAARSALPQFNLEGLWVGKYGKQGFEMINVTYAGDNLIAYKITGDGNVPKGEVSFSVDLNMAAATENDSSDEDILLEPIELAEDAAQQWGSRFLQRFAGSGQVAAEGFVNSQWIEGQLILVGDYFSFAWLPIGHQVFFGRPSPELTLKLMQKSQSSRNTDDSIREHLHRCLEETELLDDEMEVNDGIFQSHDQSSYYITAGCFE